MFAERFGAAERRLVSFATAPAQVSDEMYVLGLRSEASVKVRDGVMDVKRLEQVDDHGLEQWRPVMKAAFPLARADVVWGGRGAWRVGGRSRARAVHG